MSTTLALDGGERTVPAGMVKSWPPLNQADRDAVMAVFDSGHLHGTHAPKATELEEKWKEYCGVEYCLITNSGTSALHMAIASAGIEPGDEVITSAFTYWATAAAILHQNAIPVFVDIEPKSRTIDPAKIEEKITEHTKAILPVDVHGMPADWDPIIEIAKKHNLVTIADSCQAHGARYKGRRVGGIADVTGFSLNRSKNLTGGEGGLYTTNNEQWAKFADKMRQFGEVIIEGEEREYNAYALGWMYRPHEFANAFTLSQLERLDYNNGKRQEFANYLTAQLEDIPGMSGPYCPDYAEPVHFRYTMNFDPVDAGVDVPAPQFREAMERALQAEGVPAGQWQRMPVPGQDVFKERKGYGKGCPWTCAHYGGNVEYRAEDYPETLKYIDTHSYITGVYPPNEMDLMELYVQAFRKVSDNAARAVELATEEVAAG
jgi:perosamine synthetase